MLCNSTIVDYVIEPVDQVKMRLAQGYCLYGQAISFGEPQQRLYQALVKTLDPAPSSALLRKVIQFSVLERKCIELLLQEKSNKQIASYLHRSHRTIENTFAGLRSKFECKKNIGIILQAQQMGFIKDGKFVI